MTPTTTGVDTELDDDGGGERGDGGECGLGDGGDGVTRSEGGEGDRPAGVGGGEGAGVLELGGEAAGGESGGVAAGGGEGDAEGGARGNEDTGAGGAAAGEGEEAGGDEDDVGMAVWLLLLSMRPPSARPFLSTACGPFRRSEKGIKDWLSDSVHSPPLKSRISLTPR